MTSGWSVVRRQLLRSHLQEIFYLSGRCAPVESTARICSLYISVLCISEVVRKVELKSNLTIQDVLSQSFPTPYLFCVAQSEVWGSLLTLVFPAYQREETWDRTKPSTSLSARLSKPKAKQNEESIKARRCTLSLVTRFQELTANVPREGRPSSNVVHTSTFSDPLPADATILATAYTTTSPTTTTSTGATTTKTTTTGTSLKFAGSSPTTGLSPERKTTEDDQLNMSTVSATSNNEMKPTRRRVFTARDKTALSADNPRPKTLQRKHRTRSKPSPPTSYFELHSPLFIKKSYSLSLSRSNTSGSGSKFLTEENKPQPSGSGEFTNDLREIKEDENKSTNVKELILPSVSTDQASIAAALAAPILHTSPTSSLSLSPHTYSINITNFQTDTSNSNSEGTETDIEGTEQLAMKMINNYVSKYQPFFHSACANSHPHFLALWVDFGKCSVLPN